MSDNNERPKLTYCFHSPNVYQGIVKCFSDFEHGKEWEQGDALVKREAILAANT